MQESNKCLQQINDVKSISEINPELSKMMTAVYGAGADQQVYDRCQELDPIFNDFVQNVIYDWLWALPPLSLADKSLITVVSLLALEKAEQLKIHLCGMLHLKKSSEYVESLINHMHTTGYMDNKVTALEQLKLAASIYSATPVKTIIFNKSFL